MSGGSIAAVVADSINGMASSPVAEPTAQQAARFQQQLQLPNSTTGPAYYAAPLAETSGVGSDFRAIVDYVGEASARFNTSLGQPATPLDPKGLPPELQAQLQLQKNLSEGMLNMGNATLEFEVIGKSVDLAESLPRILYQQG